MFGQKRAEKKETLDDSGYIVQYDRRGCIGAGICEAFAPDFFVVNTDKKAELKGSVSNAQTSLFERTVPESAFASLKQAADGCPTNVIHIIDKKTGEKLI